MTEQLLLMVLAIAVAINAALIVALLLVVGSSVSARRTVEDEADRAPAGARADPERILRSPIAVDVRSRDEPRRAPPRHDVPVPAIRRSWPAVADPDARPYGYRFGTVAIDETVEDDRSGREADLEPDLGLDRGRPSAPDAAPEESSMTTEVADAARSGQPRRFQVVMPHDPQASRTIETFISSPGAAGRSRRGAPGDRPRPTSGDRDERTGLLGPAAWNALVSDEEARLDRYRRSVTVLFAELDGLERLEDRFGEAPADRILRAISTIFAGEARASDRVARIGAGRFGVLLTETDERAAARYATRVDTVANAWLESAGVSIRLAIGWASPRTSGGLALAIRTAEARLRAAEMERRGHATEGGQA